MENCDHPDDFIGADYPSLLLGVSFLDYGSSNYSFCKHASIFISIECGLLDNYVWKLSPYYNSPLALLCMRSFTVCSPNSLLTPLHYQQVSFPVFHFQMSSFFTFLDISMEHSLLENE